MVKQRKKQKEAMDDLSKPREVKNKFTAGRFKNYLEAQNFNDYGSVDGK